MVKASPSEGEMPSMDHQSQPSDTDHDLDVKARYIAKSITESLESPLIQAIKNHLASNALDWELIDPELHLEALLVGRRNARPYAQQLQIAPLRLQAVGSLPSTPEEGSDSTIPYPSPISTTSRELRSRHGQDGTAAHFEDNPRSIESRRPHGGLRLRGDEIEDPARSRGLTSDARTFPKRRKANEERSAMKPSTLDKLVTSIWEQLHGSLRLDPQVLTDQWNYSRTIEADTTTLISPDKHQFSKVNLLCRKITKAARCCRSLEVLVQAHWVACYDDRVRQLAEQNPTTSITKYKMIVLKEACADFDWTEKDLRNKMAVWRGYHEIKQAGGWAPLVFAGMGLYRYCKYRIDFTPEALSKLSSLRTAFEVAADTLHPQWRQLLSIVGESTVVRYTGHPHDWVIGKHGAIPLRETYLQWDQDFSFQHLTESTINEDAWGDFDPRSRDGHEGAENQRDTICEKCGESQSDILKENNCYCFPNLYGGAKGAIPVQVFRTPGGKNNGLMALCSFPRGTAIGEFVGEITSSLNNLDCMQSSVDGGPIYQIFQRRKGNFTRFINHSCLPNSQYERFTWLGLQRIVLVSRGIEPGQEITVDYGEGYWRNLDKICQCGESCCRYRERRLLEGPG